MQDRDDSSLLRQYAEASSEAAFTELVTRHLNLVYSVALRQVNQRHHAEEITQAVFIILARKARQLRHDRALSSWLFQTTRLTANNFIRSEARRQRREQEAYMQTALSEATPTPAAQIIPWLDAAVAALREADRQAIVLRFYEGRNLREVGAALGTSEEAAKKRINRALEKMQRYFEQRGIHSPAATLADTIATHSVHPAPAVLAPVVIAAAVTHGATASLSLTNLITGALKHMAWTQTKKYLIAGTATLLAAGGIWLLTHSTPARSPEPASDLTLLQGDWVGVEPAGPQGRSRMTITATNLDFRGADPREWYKATITLREDQQPKQMTVLITACPAPPFVGKKGLSIYKIEGNTLTIAGNAPGDPKWPGSFEYPHARKLIFTKK